METRFVCRLHNGATVLNPYTPVRFDDDIDFDYYSPSTSSLTLSFEPFPVNEAFDPRFAPPAQCFNAHVWAWQARQYHHDMPF